MGKFPLAYIAFGYNNHKLKKSVIAVLLLKLRLSRWSKKVLLEARLLMDF